MSRVWITGASSGIGAACAREFARRGFSLVLSARRESELNLRAEECLKLGAEKVEVLAFDLSDKDSLESAAQKAWDAFGGLDIFFCNAGISQRCDVAEADLETVRRIFEVDYFSPYILTKTILEKMLGNGGGQLACTCSIAGLFGSRHRSAYSGSKAALQRLYETIDAEYYDKGIKTTVIIPGRVQTPISLSALEADGKAHNVMDPGQKNGISAEKAAKKIVRSILRGRKEVLVGGFELAAAYIKRFIPCLSRAISRKVNN
ncbi:MAG: SDR family NAD(P)-dependent oxidoreductase [Candidatus Cryptobacteroides sp.]